MALPPPKTLSPSKVSTFTQCGLKFRFETIEGFPSVPTIAMSKGTLVHSALEHLFYLPAEDRDEEHGEACLQIAYADFLDEWDYRGLELNEKEAEDFINDARKLMVKYFKLEDPSRIEPVGLELRCEAQIDGVRLRGVIDRLELDEDGGLIVTDYKTGKSPPPQFEKSRLGGVHFYAFMVEQFFGVRPSKVQLLFLGDGKAVIATPTEQTARSQRKKLDAIWGAIERSCEREDFRPNPSKLCGWCDFQEFCPSFGGNIEEGVQLGMRVRKRKEASA